MAHKVDTMDLKQLITLHLDGVSNRQIAELLSINRNTVNHYMRLFKASDLSLDELKALNTRAFIELFSDKTTINNSRFSALMSFFETMHAERNHPGFTLQYHYQLYKEEVIHPYSYTQFATHYRKKYKQAKGSMKLDHPAGKELFVDFAGKKLEVIDRSTGEVTEMEVFIATLPFSQYTYVEACKSQKREDFIHCLNNALQFFGGVPPRYRVR